MKSFFSRIFGWFENTPITEQVNDSVSDDDEYSLTPDAIALEAYKDKMNEDRKKASARFKGLVGLYGAVILAILFFAILPLSLATSMIYFNVASLVLITYVVAGIRTVQPNESGVKKILGRRVGQIIEGLEWVPPIIGELDRLPIDILQDELPTEPQFIFRTKEDQEDQVPPEGYYPPTRVPFGWPISSVQIDKVTGKSGVWGFKTLEHSIVGLKEEEAIAKDEMEHPEEWATLNNEEKVTKRRSRLRVEVTRPGMLLSRDGYEVILFNAEDDDPLNERVTEEVVSLPRYYIIDPMKFVKRLFSLEKARSQLRDEVEAIYFRDYSMYTPAVIMRNTKYFNAVLLHEIRKLVGRADEPGSWGIVMESVKLKQIVLSRGLNKAVESKAKEKGRRQGVEQIALGNKYTKIQHGIGDASATKAIEKAKRVGRADGLVHLANKLGIEPKDALGTDTAIEITASESDKIVVTGNDGLSSLVGMGLAVADNISEKTKKPKVEAKEDES